MATKEVKLKITDELAERAWKGWAKKTGQRLDKAEYIGVEHVRPRTGRTGAPEAVTYGFVAVNLETFEARLAKLSD